MNIYQILCILLGVICIVQFIILLSLNYKYSKTLKGIRGREVEKVNEKNGVRYSINQDVIDENGKQHLSLSEKDIVLTKGQTEIVGKNNRVKPGKYTLLSSVESEMTFNIKLDDLVEEYFHNQQIILAEGQKITSINTTVILR